MILIPRILPLDIVRLFVIVLLWAICYPLIRVGLSYSPPISFAAMRSLVAGIFLVSVSLVYHRQASVKHMSLFLLIAIGLFASSLGFMGMFLAGNKITPGLATVIANMQPVIAAIVCYYILSERLTLSTGLALLLGFIGIIVISAASLMTGSINSTPDGILYVLLGATGVATGNVLLKRCAKYADPLVVVGWSFILGAVPLFVIAGIFESDSGIDWNYVFLINFLVLSILGTAVVYVMWLNLLRKYELNRLNIFTFLTPVIAILIGAVFFNEQLTILEWTGTALIIISVILVITSRSEKINIHP